MVSTGTEGVQPGQTSIVAGLFAGFDELMRTRRGGADQFWADVLAGGLTGDERLVVGQVLAGMLWLMQYYALGVERWLGGGRGAIKSAAAGGGRGRRDDRVAGPAGDL